MNIWGSGVGTATDGGWNGGSSNYDFTQHYTDATSHPPFNPLRTTAWRHGGGKGQYANVCFFDGHVELQASETMVYDDPINFFEASGHIIYVNKQK